jgi:hypothetical protein
MLVFWLPQNLSVHMERQAQARTRDTVVVRSRYDRKEPTTVVVAEGGWRGKDDRI